MPKVVSTEPSPVEDKYKQHTTVFSGLQNELQNKLFGQHLVLKAVVNHVRAHIENKHPPKALALSFHGGTGTGKNYVSKMIAEHLYKQGMKSKFVHLISATKEFPHEEMVHFYKDQLRNWIETNISVCSRSLFIFDEMDKMPAGLLDTIKPYLDYYEQIGGTDYRNAIFLFLSNTAGRDIINFTYNKWTDGIPRDNIKLKEIENIIIKSTVNTITQRGLWHSELITKHLITAYLPFLPLEKSHIMECIKDAMVLRKHYSDKDRYRIPGDLIKEVLNELTYFPEHEQIFSITGCKRVMEKVDYVMLQ
ncbi:hypothetical protein LOTGIDRAFT_224215 [Lottia gigantea]|uniref:Torsin-1A C-terminal domain-containing protein n=1 Tax=Lottia gigantea TaxID=225164 RepID=V4AHZ3_LOTGI|nr:hypothetical protein LOTGIDRAFT_224215 [Lottia gigantea]ESP03689.1 hypothetical protein LOTGIDRAFT_224215 [Lottia gigantea]